MANEKLPIKPKLATITKPMGGPIIQANEIPARTLPLNLAISTLFCPAHCRLIVNICGIFALPMPIKMTPVSKTKTNDEVFIKTSSAVIMAAVAIRYKVRALVPLSALAPNHWLNTKPDNVTAVI